ncbi:hypothetical protein Ocin01_17664, partial [Orchesella cincta]
MKRLFLICIIFQLSLIWEAACFPTGEFDSAEPQLDSNAVSLAKGVECSLRDTPTATQKSGIITPEPRWTKFYIYIDPTYSDNDRLLISNAAYWLGRVPSLCCILEFGGKGPPPTDYQDTYIHIRKPETGARHMLENRKYLDHRYFQLPCLKIYTLDSTILQRRKYFLGNEPGSCVYDERNYNAPNDSRT